MKHPDPAPNTDHAELVRDLSAALSAHRSWFESLTDAEYRAFKQQQAERYEQNN